MVWALSSAATLIGCGIGQVCRAPQMHDRPKQVIGRNPRNTHLAVARVEQHLRWVYWLLTCARCVCCGGCVLHWAQASFIGAR